MGSRKGTYVDAFNSPFGGIFVRRVVVEGSPRLRGRVRKFGCKLVNSPAPPTSPDRRPSGVAPVIARLFLSLVL